MLSNISTHSTCPVYFPKENSSWFTKPSSNPPPGTVPNEPYLCSVYGWIFCTVMSESRTPSRTPICRMNIPFCLSVSWLTLTSRIISTRLFFLGSSANVDNTDPQNFNLTVWGQVRFLVSFQNVSALNTKLQNHKQRACQFNVGNCVIAQNPDSPGLTSTVVLSTSLSPLASVTLRWNVQVPSTRLDRRRTG